MGNYLIVGLYALSDPTCQSPLMVEDLYANYGDLDSCFFNATTNSYYSVRCPQNVNTSSPIDIYSCSGANCTVTPGVSDCVYSHSIAATHCLATGYGYVSMYCNNIGGLLYPNNANQSFKLAVGSSSSSCSGSAEDSATFTALTNQCITTGTSTSIYYYFVRGGVNYQAYSDNHCGTPSGGVGFYEGTTSSVNFNSTCYPFSPPPSFFFQQYQASQQLYYTASNYFGYQATTGPIQTTSVQTTAVVTTGRKNAAPSSFTLANTLLTISMLAMVVLAK